MANNIMKTSISFEKNSTKAVTWLAGIALLVLGFPHAGYGVLGGDTFSVQADQLRMKASVKTTQAEAYTVQEMQGTSGTVVREYVSPAGKVFAVAWKGPFLPDLHQILGASFAPFTQAVQAQKWRRLGHGPVAVRQPGLVVLSGGHPRDYVGKAYLPDLMPQGVTAEEIR